MNLYQKHRPRSLDNIKGHNKIIKELKKRSKEDNFPQVIHLTGGTGTGKTTIARIIAKNILCLEKDDKGNSCEKCSSCVAINSEHILDIYYEFNGSNIGIDEMRDIDNLAQRRSLSKVRRKVIVIDELQELSSNKKAQKNILKVLEQPLKGTYFILGSMDKKKVDKAILNRAVSYNLKSISVEDISICLKEIAEVENINIVEDKEKIDALITVAENSEGSMRTAISYLERLINSDVWAQDDIYTELDIMSEKEVEEITKAILSGDLETISKYPIKEDIFNLLRYKIILLYKLKVNIKLNSWEYRQAKNIETDVSIDVLQKIIESLFDIQKFNYITDSYYNYISIQLTYYVKENSGNRKKRRLEE